MSLFLFHVPGVGGWLRLLLVALPGLFYLPFCNITIKIIEHRRCGQKVLAELETVTCRPRNDFTSLLLEEHSPSSVYTVCLDLSVLVLRVTVRLLKIGTPKTFAVITLKLE